jgi:mannose-6-phosphate isomerase-like protein (cupin superfamily)
MHPIVNIAAALDAAGRWDPQVVGAVNGYDVKVANVEGEFTEHQHDETDEFFLVLAGRFTLDLPQGRVELGVGDTFTVPRGTPHRPSAQPGTQILMVEPRGTVNTGDPATGTAGHRLVDPPDPGQSRRPPVRRGT